MHDADTTRPEERTEPQAPARPRRGGGFPWPLLVIIAAIVGMWWFMQRPAQTPRVFAQGVVLDEAVRQAGPGGLVFAVATADWCAPCQSYKRGALVDEGVEAWIDRHAVPVYVDIDANPGDAQRLGVRGIPATYLLRDGEVIASTAGAVSAGELLAWLERSSAQ